MPEKRIAPERVEKAAYKIIRQNFKLNHIPVHEPSARQSAHALASLVNSLLIEQNHETLAPSTPREGRASQVNQSTPRG